MTEHSPGPWEWKTTPGSDHEYCTVYSTATGRAVARHVLPCDAPFIASTPELLAALKAMLHAVETYGHMDKTDRLARAAIARAEPEKK